MTDTRVDERPRVHFSPAANWMNDPNGPIWADGRFHTFFQHNPVAPVPGNTSWGHAVSTDLLHWEQLPLAIPHDETELVYSGSVVRDGGARAPESRWVAVYTSAFVDGPRRGEQAQSLAFSADGVTWRKHAGNPVLSRGSSDFRDPRVIPWRDGDTPSWVMVAVEAMEGTVVLYRSDDLVTWRYLSRFQDQSWSGGRWEVPDLFPLPRPDGAGTSWVLTVGVDANPNRPSGGSGSIAFIGSFDGEHFRREEPVGWLDHGSDFYAATTFADVPDERRIAIGWMSNLDDALAVPGRHRRGVLTLPRELTLERDLGTGGLVVRSRPVRELDGAGDDAAPRPVGHGSAVRPVACPTAFRLGATLSGTSGAFGGLEMLDTTGRQVRIGRDPEQRCVVVERAVPPGHDEPRPTTPLRGPCAGDQDIELDVVVDVNSVEVFAAQGPTTMTAQWFPRTGVRLRLLGPQTAVRDVTLSALR